MKISKNKLLIVTLLLLIFFTSRAQDVEISGSCITNTNALVLGGDTSNTTYNGNPVYYNRTLPVNYQGNAITTNLYLYYALASELGTPENRWVVAYGGQPYYYYITNATTAPLGQYLPFDTNATVTDCGGSVTISLPCTSFTTPLFDSVASICSGASLNDLPTISNNSYTGTWSPGIDNTATTTYTFAPGVNQCAVSTTMTVVVNPSVTPEFTQVAPICTGDNFVLPTTSNNGVTGTWSPAINNTATTTYSFTASAGQCATAITMTVEVNSSNSQVVTGDSTSITANAAVLHGSILGTPCAPITETGIEYSGISGFVNGFGIKVPATNLAAGNFSSQLTGLVQNTVYYYKAYAKSGSTITYGEQKLFITSAIPSGLTVYSTPIVRGTNVHYTLSGIKPGHYAVRIFNSVGQLVYQKDMILQLNFIDDNFILPAKLPIGLYTLQVFNPTFKIQKSMMVQ